MGLFSRLRAIFLGSAHDALDKIEDPILLMNQYIRDMESECEKAHRMLVEQAAFEARIHRQHLSAAVIARKREAQATMAMRGGDETLAREALKEKLQYEQQMEALELQLVEATKNTAALRAAKDELTAKLQELKNQRIILSSRAQTAKAKKQMNKALSALDSESSVAKFKRMEEKILRMETEADAMGSLREQTLEQRLSKLPDPAVDAELERLKQQLNTAI